MKSILLFLSWRLLSTGVLEALPEITTNTTCRRKCSADPLEPDPCVPEVPRFLLAGQSNAQGLPHQALEDLFNVTIDLVNQRYQEPMPTNREQYRERRRAVTDKLIQAFGNAKDAKEGSSTYMAKQIYKMAGTNRTVSVLNKDTILAPHPDVVCSFTNPYHQVTPDCERPVSPIIGEACGGGFPERNHYGPELMFAHHFPKLDTKYKNTKFGITKVAAGGTRISQWTENSGSVPNYWFSLKDNIHADNGSIEALFWFQGENNHFPITPQEEYLEELKVFVEKVREEIFLAHRARWGEEGSPTAQFRSAKDVPVVILELGPWIGNGVAEKQMGAPGSVILAQRQFVEEDPNSILVNTGTDDDEFKRLSAFYHFDAPSQLIIGHRLAESFKELLDITAANMNTTMTNTTTTPDDTIITSNTTANSTTEDDVTPDLITPDLTRPDSSTPDATTPGNAATDAINEALLYHTGHTIVRPSSSHVLT